MIKYNLTYIVDDDPIFYFILKKLLSKMDNFKEIKNLKNGYIALCDLKEKFKNNEEFPNIIFLDLNMPVLDGWQFLDELEKLPFKENLTIYIISSTIDSNEIMTCKKYNSVINFIQKPTSESDLRSVLGL
jgi:response regulator RpfG family c-di-GMP phosphodiesterase